MVRENRVMLLSNMRVTQVERRVVEAVAQSQGTTLVEAVRTLIRVGSQSMGLWPEQPEPRSREQRI